PKTFVIEPLIANTDCEKATGEQLQPPIALYTEEENRYERLKRMSRYAASAVAVAGIVLCVVLLVQVTEARPSALLSRPKRVSDQRLAELETLIALQKMRGKLVTVPIGFGKVDPMKILSPGNSRYIRNGEIPDLSLCNNSRPDSSSAILDSGTLPYRRGRKRRSSTETSWQELSRILRSIVEEDAELSPKDRIRFARLFSSRWDEVRNQDDTPTANDRGEDGALY
ncbi:hypothetical protein TSAR_013175, partial [Trichomalopsis sarcophagae]